MNYRVALLLPVLLALGSQRAAAQDIAPFIEEVGKLKGPKAPVRLGKGGASNLAFTPDSRFLVTRSAWTLAVWDVRKYEKVAEWKVPESNSIAVTPDGASVAVGTNDGHVLLYDLATRRKQRTWTVPNKRRVLQVAFNEDGSLTAAATCAENPGFVRGGSIYVWEATTKAGEPRYSLPDVLGYPHAAFVDSVIAFVPGKKVLLSTGLSGGAKSDGDASGPAGKACRHDLETRKTQALLSNSAESRIAVSRDGRLWLMDFTAWVDGKAVPSSFERKHFVLGVAARFQPALDRFALCPKGRYLVAVRFGRDGAEPGLTMWEVVKTERQVVFKERVFIHKFKYRPQTWAFSPDGALLAVAAEGAVLLWDAKALLPVTNPAWLNEDLQAEMQALRERIEVLERRLKELEAKR
jgi:WD40 repeat protein